MPSRLYGTASSQEFIHGAGWSRIFILLSGSQVKLQLMAVDGTLNLEPAASLLRLSAQHTQLHPGQGRPTLLTLCVALRASTRDRLSVPRAAHPSSAAVRSAWCLQFGAPGPPVAPPSSGLGESAGCPKPRGGAKLPAAP